MALLGFQAVLRECERPGLSFRHVFCSILSYIFAKLPVCVTKQPCRSLGHLTHAHRTAGVREGVKDHFSSPSRRRAGGLVKLSSISATTLGTGMVSFRNNAPFPRGLGRGMFTCISVLKIQGEAEKRGGNQNIHLFYG